MQPDIASPHHKCEGCTLDRSLTRHKATGMRALPTIGCRVLKCALWSVGRLKQELPYLGRLPFSAALCAELISSMDSAAQD